MGLNADSTRFRLICFALTVGIMACSTAKSENLFLPVDTAVPVEFSRALTAGKVHINEPVWAKTLQVIMLPDGRTIAKGSIVSGRVTNSSAFVYDHTPYATQSPSILAIRFDTITTKDVTYTVHLNLRALADASEASSAESPHWRDELDDFGIMKQVGGDFYEPGINDVHSYSGDVVGYSRRQGVFAKLLVGSESGITCSATQSEQSVAIFSAGACGLYGFDRSVFLMPDKANRNSLQLGSRRYSVMIPANSAALLVEQGERSNELSQNSPH